MPRALWPKTKTYNRSHIVTNSIQILKNSPFQKKNLKKKTGLDKLECILRRYRNLQLCHMRDIGGISRGGTPY